MKKVFLVLTIAVCLVASVFAGGASEKKAAPGTFRVGVVQLVQHPALDAATEGFMKALVEQLGDKVSFDIQNASGEINNCATIVNGFVSSNTDLIMANATPALTAAVSATNIIPVLGTSVTDYGVALDIDNFSGLVGTNVSGTSDLAPLDEQAAMIKEWFPNTRKVGLLYCSAEPNSIYQVNSVEKYLTQAGIECRMFSFTDTNDVASVTQKAAAWSDVIYIPTDNTAAANTEAIANVVLAAKVPVIAGEEGICTGCGVATLCISYYDLGVATGKMAAQVLTGEKKISEMPIGYAAEVTKKYNATVCNTLGIKPLAGYTAL